MTYRPNSVLLYGKSGVGKTNQTFRLVRWILEQEKKKNPKAKARLISADGGGFTPFEKSRYIEKGYVEAFDIVRRDKALADIRRLADGYWPLYPNAPNEVFDNSSKCRVKDSEWSNIPVLVIEGITSISTQWIHHCSDQEAGMGFKHSWTITEDEYVIGGQDKGHYGIVQKETLKLLIAFNALPVKWIIWTALAQVVTDKDADVDTNGGGFIIAPEAVGKAISLKIPSYLGTTFYLEKKRYKRTNKETGEKEEIYGVAAHFEDGIDGSTGNPFLTKCRVIEDAYPAFKKRFPKGCVQTFAGEVGIEKYFVVEDEIMNELYGDK